jgi:TolB protein
MITLIAVTVLVTAMAQSAAPAAAKVAGPNGRIAFARYDPNFGDSFTYTANPDGSDVRALLPAYTSGSPRWSPDGREVAVVSGLGVPCPPTCTGNTVVINPDTGASRVLASEGYPAVSTFCSIWSSNASHFACEGFNDDDASVNGLYTIRASDGGDLTRITTAPNGMHDIPIDYSPNGTQIAFGRTDINHNCTSASGIFVVNTDGSGQRRITPPGYCDDDGSWSPDGTKIAFASHHRLGALIIAYPDGRGLAQIPLRVSGLRGVGDISWSPDGTKLTFILFTQQAPGTGQEGVYTANADGTDVRQATLSPTFDNQTDWGPHPLQP